MAKDINFTQILSDEASFQLVRTNPKLTGNVKFTVDANDNMWLNSIDANEELSKSIYKRVPIDPSISLPGNVYKFFSNGETPSEIVFDLNESFDSTKTSSDFKDQFDFSHYFSGVRYLTSRRYSEKLSYFAPIFLKKDLPEYFVIFKINDPLNKNIEDLRSEYPYDRESYIKDLFLKSTIIKTFDLRQTTKIGKYLKDYTSDPLFPNTPLDVTYQEDQLTNFNGILYDAGVLGSRGEDLYDFYKSSNPLKYFEDFITSGFERNSIIFPNIINMEFIFDDDTSDLYDFNRYFGVYVNAVELSKLEIDLERAYRERSTWENEPRFRKTYYDWENVTINQSNQDGVVIPVKNLEVYLSDFENIFNDKDSMFFNYITDKDGSIHLPKLQSPYNIDYDSDSTELNSAKITMSNVKLDIGKMFGPSVSFLQDKGSTTNANGYSHCYIKIELDSQFEGLKIYHPHGSRSDVNGKYDIIEGISGYSEVPNPGDYYVYNDIDGTAGYNIYYVNNEGSAAEISKAITTCINQIYRASFKAVNINNYIFIKSNIPGDYDTSYSLEYVSASSNYDNITINDISGANLIGNVIQFEGGSKEIGNRLIINQDHLSKIDLNINDILVKTKNGWSRIKKTSKYIDSITESNLTTSTDVSKALKDFFDFGIVTLENNDSPLIEYGEFVMFQKFKPSFGILSFFPIKDFDFDFYSSEYLNFPKIDLHQYYYIPEGLSLISSGVEYKAYGNGRILLSTGEEFIINDEGTVQTYEIGGPYSYQILEGDVIIEVEPRDITTGSPINTNLWAPLYDENGELEDFEGFFLIKDPDLVIPESQNGLYRLRDKYLNGLARSEYDFYKENNSKDFALKSKIIPYITKWAIKDGFDARSNPYRLNSELVFGFNNFSPDHEDRSQNPSNFTHEWYYIESFFNYVESENLVKNNNSYFPYSFDIDRALSEKGYFIDYFTYTPTFNGKEVGRTQTRYTPISKNNQGVYETFFKGFKIQFKDYIDPSNLNESGKPEFNPNSNRFEDYKFSCLLKPIEENINEDGVPPIRYRFIEHKDFKFILLLIEVNVGSINNIDQYWSFTDGSNYESLTLDNLLDDDSGSILSQAYNSINGDYRIKFTDVDGYSISNLNHTLLYSLRHKKFNNTLDNFSNVKLSKKLNLKTAFIDTPENSIVELSQSVGIYPSKFNEELHNISEKTLLTVYDKAFNEDRIVDNFPNSENKMISVSGEYIQYDEDSINAGDINLRSASTGTIFQTLPSASSTANYTLNNYVFKILSGGELYFETLFEKLSFGEFKEQVNSLSPFIEYETYSFNGSVNQVDSNIYTEVPDSSVITKTDAIVTTIDEDKPSNLSFSSTIGFNYQRSQLDNSYDLNRYEGGFTPLFKDLIFFNSKFNFVKNDINSLDLSNTRFNINVNSFMKLNNFNHIKISNTKILDLESDEEYEPLYESAGEIAIGRSDYDLLQSNWDWGFHHLYTNKFESTPVSGAIRIEEDDSFIGKIVNVRENIELENFNIDIVDRIDTINIDNYEIVYTVNDNNINGRINVENALVRYLLSDGIASKFQEFLKLDPEYIGNYETFEDYVREYVNLNISRLYEILEVEFYAKDDRTLNDPDYLNKNSIEFVMLDDKSRFEQGFEPIKNLQINKIDRFILNFEFSKKLNSGLLISPKIKIRFI